MTTLHGVYQSDPLRCRRRNETRYLFLALLPGRRYVRAVAASPTDFCDLFLKTTDRVFADGDRGEHPAASGGGFRYLTGTYSVTGRVVEFRLRLRFGGGPVHEQHWAARIAAADVLIAPGEVYWLSGRIPEVAPSTVRSGPRRPNVGW
jgi:hypothetical protein